MWHKNHPLPFPWWKETSFWECTEDLNIISLICEVITSWCHQNTAQFGTTDHSNALMWFMYGLYHRGARLFTIYFSVLGSMGSLGGVSLLQLQSISIIFNLHRITPEFYWILFTIKLFTSLSPKSMKAQLYTSEWRSIRKSTIKWVTGTEIELLSQRC